VSRNARRRRRTMLVVGDNAPVQVAEGWANVIGVAPEPPALTLTKGTYPVQWEMGFLVMQARLVIEDGWLRRWNGFVCPAFTREEVERYGAWVDERPDSGYSRVEWHGEIADVIDPEWPEATPEDRMLAPIEGLYLLGEGWTWQIAEGEL
jgi:hypothetical protein